MMMGSPNLAMSLRMPRSMCADHLSDFRLPFIRTLHDLDEIDAPTK
jgi:hypothetical protein